MEQKTAYEIVRIDVGDVILLNHPVAVPLTLVVDGTPTFDARIGRKNRRLAVQIVRRSDPGSPLLRPTRFSADTDHR